MRLRSLLLAVALVGFATGTRYVEAGTITYFDRAAFTAAVDPNVVFTVYDVHCEALDCFAVSQLSGGSVTAVLWPGLTEEPPLSPTVTSFGVNGPLNSPTVITSSFAVGFDVEPLGRQTFDPAGNPIVDPNVFVNFSAGPDFDSLGLPILQTTLSSGQFVGFVFDEPVGSLLWSTNPPGLSRYRIVDLTIKTVPEPSTLVMLASGILLLQSRRWTRRAQSR